MNLKWESEFLFTEPKNKIHEHTNTHGGKWMGFIREKKITKLLAKTLRGGKESRRGRIYSSFYILNLYIFGSLLKTCNFKQSV